MCKLRFLVKWEAFLDRRHSVANSLTIELLALEEITRALADLFGLPFPFPRKRKPL